MLKEAIIFLWEILLSATFERQLVAFEHLKEKIWKTPKVLLQILTKFEFDSSNKCDRRIFMLKSFSAHYFLRTWAETKQPFTIIYRYNNKRETWNLVLEMLKNVHDGINLIQTFNWKSFENIIQRYETCPFSHVNGVLWKNQLLFLYKLCKKHHAKKHLI